MNTSVEFLFDEFAARHARGEHPDSREYLERAGESRDELAGLLDGFLAAASVQPPGEETLALFAKLLPEESEMPPLLAERVRRGWRRDDVVDWIRDRFGIAEEKREKVDRYWHELETGLLPVSGVSDRLREALSERFGYAAETALAWKAPAYEADVAFRRLPGALYELQAKVESPQAPEPTPETDDVDRLFGTSRLG